MALCTYVLVGGIVSFLGYPLDLPRLTDWDNDGISIQPNASICVVFSGLGLLLITVGRRRVGLGCAAIVFLLGGSTWLEWNTGFSFGLDDLFMFGREWGRRGVVYPGRMGPPGSLSWMLIGAALLVTAVRPKRKDLRRIVPALALVTVAISAVSLLGYLYGADLLYTLPRLTIIALQTSTFVMAISLAIIASHPELEPMRTLLDPGSAGLLARRIVPILILVATGLGFLRVTAQQTGFIDLGMGVAIHVLSQIALLLIALWWTLRTLRYREAKQQEHADELARTHSALHAREQRLRRMINIDAVGVLFFDQGGRLVDCNDAFLAMTGYRREQIASRALHWRDLTPPEHIETSQRQMDQFAQRGRIGPYEKEYFRSDGSRLWMLFAGADLGDETIIEYCIDISDQKKAEEEVRRQSEMIRAVNDNTEELIFMKDTSGRLTYANAATLRSIGGTLDDCAPLDRETFFAPEEHPGIRANDVCVIERGETVRTEEIYTSPDGVTRTYLSTKSPLRDAHGTVVGVIGVSRDVTELKQAEHALREALADTQLLHRLTIDMARPGLPNELFDRIMDAAVSIMQADFASIQLLHPERGQHGELRLLASRGYDVVAKEFWEWVRADSGCTCGAAMRTGKRSFASDIRTCEFMVGSAEQANALRLGIVAMQSTPLISRAGKLLGILSTHWKTHHEPDERKWRMFDVLAQLAADLLERMQTEQALREADRRKDEFLATLAHELRNPLAPLRNALEILSLKSPADGAGDAELVTMMDRQLHHLVRLVDDLLDVSRITRDKIELKRERVTLQSVVGQAVETVRSLCAAQNHALVSDVPEATIWLDADPARLVQVFGNLLTNACRYTNPGGTIKIVAIRDGEHVRVTVSDNGIGIPRDQLDAIFEMFGQLDRSLERAQGGLGIGLYLVKRLVELHGGEISGNSDGPGHGSRFTVRLPVAVGAPVPAPHTSAKMPTASRRVLVVDDNHDSARSLALLLKIAGNETQVAHDGHEAIEMTATFSPHVVLLDIGLPKLNGYDACREIRRLPRGHGIYVVAVTGWGQDDDRARSREAGFDDHLVKPLDHAHLARILSNLENAEVQS